MEIINYEPGDYYYAFPEHMQNYSKIKSAKALLLLSELCSRAEWNTGRVLLPAGIKKEICTEIESDYSNISKLLRMLESSDFITKKAEGVYFINPKSFWRGELEEREKLLEQQRHYPLL